MHLFVRIKVNGLRGFGGGSNKTPRTKVSTHQTLCYKCFIHKFFENKWTRTDRYSLRLHLFVVPFFWAGVSENIGKIAFVFVFVFSREQPLCARVAFWAGNIGHPGDTETAPTTDNRLRVPTTEYPVPSSDIFPNLN